MLFYVIRLNINPVMRDNLHNIEQNYSFNNKY